MLEPDAVFTKACAVSVMATKLDRLPVGVVALVSVVALIVPAVADATDVVVDAMVAAESVSIG